MDLKTIIINFNNIISNLLEQTSCMIGESYLFYFNKIVKINSFQPIQTFLKYGYSHKKDILNKNPEYFLNNDNLKTNFDNNYDEYFTEIIRLKEVYINVNDQSKENLWKILNALVILTDKYVEINKQYQFKY